MASLLLLVGENPAVSRFVRSVVAKAFPETPLSGATTAREGLAMAADSTPSLILLNVPLSDATAESFALDLGKNVRTALTPVLLLHADGLEPEKLLAACPNIVETLQKPFSPEQLEAAIRSSMKGLDSARQIQEKRKTSGALAAGIGMPRLLYRSSGDLVNWPNLLGWLQESSATGILRFWGGRQAVEWFFNEGQSLFLSTRDIAAYSTDAPIRLEGVAPEILATAAKGQMDSGSPCFLLLGHRGALPPEEALQRTHDYGIRLLTRLIAGGFHAVEFEDIQPLPEIARDYHSPQPDALAQVLEAARLVPGPSAAGLYDRAGSLRFIAPVDILATLLTLNDEEVEWIQLAVAQPEISQLIGDDWETCASMILRTTLLGIFRYFPPAAAEIQN